jgi:hypothetical protein
MKDATNNGYDVKVPTNTFNKIKLMRVIESTYDIKTLDVSFDKDGEITMTDEVFTLLRSVFKTQKSKPTNYKELKKLYVGIIKSITFNEIKTRKRVNVRSGGRRGEYDYIIDVDLIKYPLELNKYKNKNCHGFSSVYVDMFNIDVAPMENQTTEFIDYGLDT